MTDLGDFTTITIDKREPEGMEDLFIELEYFVDWVQHDEEESYDYRQGDIVVERKTINDFIQSFKKPHMWEQLEKMQQYDAAYLIIVGDLAEGAYTRHGATIPQILGAMSSIAVRYQIHPMRADNDRDFAYLVGKIFQSHRDGNMGVPRKVKIDRTRKKAPIAARIISLVGGMDQKAIEIAEELELETIHDVASLTIDELEKVNGIGKKKAGNIIDELKI